RFRNYLEKHTSSAGASKYAKMLRDLLPGRMRGLLRLPMRNFVAGSAILVLLAGVSHAKTKSHPTSKLTQHTASSSSKNHKRHGHPRKGAWKRHGQQGIATDRVREIQVALIREKYLEGAPSGKWDSATQQAMAQFQSDHGWQSKVTPDSRALIKLGLGPNYSQAMLNPDGKSTADAMASNTSSAGASRNK